MILLKVLKGIVFAWLAVIFIEYHIALVIEVIVELVKHTILKWMNKDTLVTNG